jgi:hypothetical protein
MKKSIALGLIAIGSLVSGCAKQMPSAPNTDNTMATSLQGTWDYVATDTTDLSGYGITYNFDGGKWIYTLGDAGSKVYDISTQDGHFLATLVTNDMHSSDAIGSTVQGTYRFSSDTLVMAVGGHNAILTRE